MEAKEMRMVIAIFSEINPEKDQLRCLYKLNEKEEHLISEHQINTDGSPDVIKDIWTLGNIFLDKVTQCGIELHKKLNDDSVIQELEKDFKKRLEYLNKEKI
jgi:hypothetical protein